MRIIEIAALDNGAHRNQTGFTPAIPDGWAIVPEDMETLNYPFGEITVDDQTPPVVTSWTPLPIPEPEPVEQPDVPESDLTVWEQLDAAYREGVASAYDS